MFAVIATVFASYKTYNASSLNQFSLMSEDIDALSGCEVFYNNELIFRCEGEEGLCCATLTRNGKTIYVTCSGTPISN